MTSTCDCLRLQPDSGFTIPPHGVAEVRATLALRMKSECQRSRGESEPHTIPVRVTFAASGGSQQERVFTLTGHIRPAFRLNATNLSLGMVSVRQADLALRIDVEVGAHVAKITVEAPPRWAVDVPAALFEANQKGKVT